MRDEQIKICIKTAFNECMKNMIKIRVKTVIKSCFKASSKREYKRAFNDKHYHIKERSDANMIMFVIECPFIFAHVHLKQRLMTV